MMIKNCLLLALLPACTFVYSQNTKPSALYKMVMEKRQFHTVQTVHLFEKDNTGLPAAIKSSLSMGQALLLGKNKSRGLFATRPAGISLIIPFNNAEYKLELVQENISNGETAFGKLTGKGNREKTGTIKAVHYRGFVYGSMSSYASFSVFADGSIMCLFANEEGNFNLGKLKDGKYILYNSAHMPSHPGFVCGTEETPAGSVIAPAFNIQNATPMPLDVPPLLCNKIRIYWEGNYKLYNYNFGNSLQATANYLSGLFNQVATMYRNEGIVIELTEVYIWVTQDPYITTSSATGLSSIKSRWNALGDTFNGDFCVLIDGGETTNGGRAYILTFTLCNRVSAYGYANVYGLYNNVPTYSWDVEVVTHEMGHMMGSHHTHWCGWGTGAGGACGAIDDCYTLESVTGCTTCSAAVATNPTPPAGFKGTVMSYCHLRSGIGINLANGFGPLPQAAIRNMVENAFCMGKNNLWTGAHNTAWENVLNWSCASIPDTTTDVTIPGRLVNYPIINSNAACRMLTQEENTSVEIKPGFNLKVVGKND